MKTSMQCVKEITNEVKLGPCRTSLQYQFVPQGGAASQCHLYLTRQVIISTFLFTMAAWAKKSLLKNKLVIFIESFSQNLQTVITKKVFNNSCFSASSLIPPHNGTEGQWKHFVIFTPI